MKKLLEALLESACILGIWLFVLAIMYVISAIAATIRGNV